MTDEELEGLLLEFPKYLAYVYSCIDLPSPTPLQIRISNILQEAPDRMILEAARGTGKSWIAAIYTTWRLLRNIDEKILIVSASGPKAIEIAIFVRKLFDQVPLLHHLIPPKGGRDSTLAFDVAGAKISIAPSVAAVGIGGQIVGRRATLVLADDVEIPSNSMTEEMREKLLNQVAEFENLLIPDVPSSVLFLGTPQSQESIYMKLTYYTTILPAQVPDDESVYEGKLDPWVLMQGPAGTPTDKVRFDLNTLSKRRAGLGNTNYKLQFMLDTTLSDAERYPLKCRDMIVHSLNSTVVPVQMTYGGSRDLILRDIPSLGFTGDKFHRPVYVSDVHEEYDTKIMAIDPSGSGTDETTYAVLGVKNGLVYLLDIGGNRGGYSEEVLIWLSMAAKRNNVSIIVPEKNFGSGMFTELFKKVLNKLYPCTIEEDFRVSGQKEVRIINNLEPLLTNHQFVIDENLLKKDYEDAKETPENLPYSLVYQITHLTRDKGSLVHDDKVDVVAIGCQYLAGLVSVDAEKLLEEARRAEMLKFLETKIYGSVVSPANNVLQYLRR